VNLYEVAIPGYMTLLVEAKSKAAARHFAATKFTVVKVSAMRAHILASRGIKIDHVAETPEDAPPEGATQAQEERD
jgi:hypothetical protein